jgi:hypothetical protein
MTYSRVCLKGQFGRNGLCQKVPLANGKFGDSNCSFDGDEQFKFPKYSIEATLVELFDPNPFYQTVRLNALYCSIFLILNTREYKLCEFVRFQLFLSQI